MLVHARLSLPDGSTVELVPGDLIGRHRGAALRFDDPRISEAHALLSLRGGELRLLALRGALALDKERVSEVTLEPGQRIRLASDLAIEVLEVVLPAEVLALEGEGLPRQVLGGSGCSLVLDPRPLLMERPTHGAAATLWTDGEGWRMQIGDGPARSFGIGDHFTVGGRDFRGVGITLARAGQRATAYRGKLHAPLRLLTRYDSVELHREGEPVLAIGGVAARVLCELADFDGAVEWETLAQQVWGEAGDRLSMRRKLDVTLSRLRGRLREAGVRPDLVQTDGTGKLGLLLHDDDTIDNRN